MSTVAVENARQQWAAGSRRLADLASDRGLYLHLLDQVRLVLDELSRKVGQTFTLAELADAYRDADRWLLDLLGTGSGVSHLALVEDAAFHIYARGALDYSP
jgi:hypothetical protein